MRGIVAKRLRAAAKSIGTQTTSAMEVAEGSERHKRGLTGRGHTGTDGVYVPQWYEWRTVTLQHPRLSTRSIYQALKREYRPEHAA